MHTYITTNRAKRKIALVNRQRAQKNRPRVPNPKINFRMCILGGKRLQTCQSHDPSSWLDRTMHTYIIEVVKAEPGVRSLLRGWAREKKKNEEIDKNCMKELQVRNHFVMQRKIKNLIEGRLYGFSVLNFRLTKIDLNVQNRVRSIFENCLLFNDTGRNHVS